MRIAIQAADLDHERIDGTRVYISELLNRFGEVADTTMPESDFLLYHRTLWNPELAPPAHARYIERALAWPFSYWTQTRFLAEMFRVRPDVLWMPMQALPFVRPAGMRSVVTIHDLAFKFFPETFDVRDLRRLNLFTDFAVHNADALIAVSDATKCDILAVYPDVPENKVTVVHHGYTPQSGAEQDESVFDTHGIGERYILYIGALQPRKNLVRLVEAFERVAQKDVDVQLVLAGGDGWLADEIHSACDASPYAARIIRTGSVSHTQRAALYQRARVFAFVSLYEGFGLPLLEAFDAGVPVVTGHNSSLPEVAGDGALYVDEKDAASIAVGLTRALTDDVLRAEIVDRGRARLAQFSWDACAEQTLAVLCDK